MAADDTNFSEEDRRALQAVNDQIYNRWLAMCAGIGRTQRLAHFLPQKRDKTG